MEIIFTFVDLEIYFIYTNYVETKTLQERDKKMLKTNLEILDFIKHRLEIAKRTKDSAASCYLEEDYFNHELMSKNLANFQKEYAVQLVLESLIEFIESDIK